MWVSSHQIKPTLKGRGIYLLCLREFSWPTSFAYCAGKPHSNLPFSLLSGLVFMVACSVLCCSSQIHSEEKSSPLVVFWRSIFSQQAKELFLFTSTKSTRCKISEQERTVWGQLIQPLHFSEVKQSSERLRDLLQITEQWWGRSDKNKKNTSDENIRLLIRTGISYCFLNCFILSPSSRIFRWIFLAWISLYVTWLCEVWWSY